MPVLSNTMINNREQDDGELFSSVSHLLPLYAFTKCPLGHLYLISLPSLPALSVCCLHFTYRIQEHTVNPVHDAINLYIHTVRSIHSDEVREKQMSQLSAVYSAEAAVLGKALHGDVHTSLEHFFDCHLFLLRDKCQVVARLLDMGDLMCTWQTYGKHPVLVEKKSIEQLHKCIINSY